jgi:hypothetical protein
MITCPEESYRLWCVGCDLETSWMRRPRPTGGCWAKGKKRLAISLICFLKRRKCQRYLSGQSCADGQGRVFCSHLKRSGHDSHFAELLILAHTKKTPYSHSSRKSTCSKWTFRFFPSGTHTSYVLHLFRGAQTPGALLPVRLNFVWWSVIFSTQLFHFSILTYLLTYSMEQSPSWEANRFCS